MSIVLYDNVRVGTGKPSEPKYLNTSNQPYTDTTQVFTQVPVGERHIGLTVNINKIDYWFKDGTADNQLILKSASSTGSTSNNGWKVSGTTLLSDTGVTINYDDKKVLFVNTDNSFTSSFKVDSTSNLFLDRKTFEIGASDITTKYINDSVSIESKIDGNGITNSVNYAVENYGVVKTIAQTFSSTVLKNENVENTYTLGADGYYLVIGSGGTVNNRMVITNNEISFIHKKGAALSFNEFNTVITSPLDISPATATKGQLRLLPSTQNVVTSNNGELWYSNDHLYIRLTGGTYQIDRQSDSTKLNVSIFNSFTGSSMNLSVITLTGATTLNASHNGKTIEANGTFTITLPNSMVAGYNVNVVNVGTGVITMAATTTLNTKLNAKKLATQYGAASFYTKGSNIYVGFGDLTN